MPNPSDGPPDSGERKPGTLRNGLAVYSTRSTELAWVFGRIVVVMVVALGTHMFLRDTTAYPFVVGCLFFALAYSVTLLFVLARWPVNRVFVLGFLLDNVTVLAGWWAIAKALSGAVQTNDLYLIIFPLIVVGLFRLGWLAGAIYATGWVGWMIWSSSTYDASGSYDLEQLPVRVLFVGVTSALVIRLVALLNRGRQQEKARTEELNQLQRFKSSLLRAISHELNTPLAAVNGVTEPLSEASEEMTAEQRREGIRILQSGVGQLKQITQRSLYYSDFGNPEDPLNLVSVDLGGLVRNVAKPFEPVAAKRSQNITVEVADPLPPLLVDPVRTSHALLSIVENALKYSPDGAGITIRANREQTAVRVEVSDLGPGIPEEDQRFIFEEYCRGSRPDENVIRGSGVGLAIARSIVERHHGTIGLADNPGGGTTAFFTLPVDSPSPSTERRPRLGAILGLVLTRMNRANP